MPFRNRRLAKKIAKAPCAWCGWTAGRRHAAHMIDEGPDAEWNAISLCPNCSTVFDEVIRPKFYKALQEYGCAKLPQSWRKDNKISERPEVLSEEEYQRLKSKLEIFRRSPKAALNRSAQTDKGVQPVDKQAAELLARVRKRIEGRQQNGGQ
jgi:hypothetical protein